MCASTNIGSIDIKYKLFRKDTYNNKRIINNQKNIKHMKIHEKNYNNLDLTIPSVIWQDKTVNGVAKVILTLVKRFTNDGNKTCYALTGQMAQMIHTHEKDIKYNLQQLHNKNHIELYKDDTSPTKWSIKYNYIDKVDTNTDNNPGTSGLF